MAALASIKNQHVTRLQLGTAEPAGSEECVNVAVQACVGESEISQECLRLVFTTAGYLARQGLALRGHDESEGNFKQLLKCRSASVPELRTWFMQKKKYTHHTVQDEILQLYGCEILRCILADVQNSQSYAVIVDGTQDINRTEQESICIRLVDENLQPREEFMGFYAVDYTTGHMLASCIKDALIRKLVDCCHYSSRCCVTSRRLLAAFHQSPPAAEEERIG